MTAEPIKVVIDTSVFIRYLIRPSAATRRLLEELWLEDQILVVIAPEIFDELSSVMKRQSVQAFISPQEGQVLLEVLQGKADFLPSLGEVPSYTRDLKDDKFVACALAVKAAYLITEDRDLLSMGEIEGVRMATPYGFLTAS